MLDAAWWKDCMIRKSKIITPKIRRAFPKDVVSVHTGLRSTRNKETKRKGEWFIMDDRMVISIGVTYAQNTMKTGNDAIQALFAALLGKSIPQQRQVLEQFAKYAQTGGRLRAVSFDMEHLAEFAAEARELELSFYAIRNKQTNQVTVIVRDCDTAQLNQVAENLAEKGRPLYPDPQRSVLNFLEANEGKEIQFCTVESIEQVMAAKWEAAKRNVEFAVGKQRDGRYIVIFRKEDVKALKDAGVIDAASKPMSELFRASSIEDVRKIVREERQTKQATKENEKQNQKNHGR